MSNNIPYEDDITKTQLWKRIDATFPIIANVKEELQPQISHIKDTAMAAIKNEIEEHKKEWDRYKADIDSKLNAYTKQIHTLISTTLQTIAEENARNINAMEKKISDWQQIVPAKVTEQAISFFNPAVSRIAEIAEDVENFKKETDKSIAKFQTEIVSKISETNAKMDIVLGKLKNIASGF